jgi:hypothetical protein
MLASGMCSQYFQDLLRGRMPPARLLCVVCSTGGGGVWGTHLVEVAHAPTTYGKTSPSTQRKLPGAHH